MSDLEIVTKRTVVGKPHKTWAGTFFCKPERYIQPTTIEEIQAVVREAHRQKRTIMLTGSGHSPSHMTMTTEWLVNLDKFNRPVEFKPDPSGKFTDVTLEAGIHIYEINGLMAAHGLAVQNLGSISEQSVAGIISTGTHGSSAFHGLVSQQIVDLTLVVASGELVKCSPQEKPDLFRAASLSLGKIGLIAYATLRTVPAYTIHSKQEVIAFDRFVEELWPTFWTSSEYLRVWWFPYTNRCILWRANKSTKPLSAPRESWYGTPIGRFFYQSLLWIAVKICPSVTPWIETFVFDKQYGLKETYAIEGAASEAVQGSVEGLNMDCLFSQFVDEWNLPLVNGPKVLYQLRDKILEAAKTKEFYVHAPIEVRCSNLTSSGSTEPIDPEKYKSTLDGQCGAIPGNNLSPWLNPAPNRPYAPGIKGHVTNENLTLYINATMYRPFGWNSPVEKWFRFFEDTVYAAGGKHHWAKNFLGNRVVTTKTKDGEMRGLEPQMEEWFGKNLSEWKRIREEYDPDGVFMSGRNWAEINGLV